MEQSETLEIDSKVKDSGENKSPLEPPYYLAGHELQAPFLNGAGLISGHSHENIIHEVETLLAAKIGAVVFGSLTLSPNEGKGAWYHDPISGESFNRMRLPNIGVSKGARLANKLAKIAHSQGVPLIVSGAPLVKAKLGTEVDQLSKLASKLLNTKADMVELDISCTTLNNEPMQFGLPLGYNLNRMYDLAEAVEKEAGITDRLLIKMPPYFDELSTSLGLQIPEKLLESSQSVVPELAKLFRTKKLYRGLVISNGIPNQIPADDNGKKVFDFIPNYSAALSGASQRVKIIARRNLDMWASELEGEVGIDLISAQGIDSGKELAARLRLKAAAGAGVTIFRNSTDWRETTFKVYGELDDYREEEKKHSTYIN